MDVIEDNSDAAMQGEDNADTLEDSMRNDTHEEEEKEIVMVDSHEDVDGDEILKDKERENGDVIASDIQFKKPQVVLDGHNPENDDEHQEGGNNDNDDNDGDDNESEPEMTSEEKQAIYEAVKAGDIDLLDDLLDLPGADINMTWFGENLLMAAIREDQQEMAEFLLDNNIDRNFTATRIELLTEDIGRVESEHYAINCRQMAYDYNMLDIVFIIDELNGQQWRFIRPGQREIRLKKDPEVKESERAAALEAELERMGTPSRSSSPALSDEIDGISISGPLPNKTDDDVKPAKVQDSSLQQANGGNTSLHAANQLSDKTEISRTASLFGSWARKYSNITCAESWFSVDVGKGKSRAQTTVSNNKAQLFSRDSNRGRQMVVHKNTRTSMSRRMHNHAYYMCTSGIDGEMNKSAAFTIRPKSYCSVIPNGCSKTFTATKLNDCQNLTDKKANSMCFSSHLKDTETPCFRNLKRRSYSAPQQRTSMSSKRYLVSPSSTMRWHSAYRPQISITKIPLARSLKGNSINGHDQAGAVMDTPSSTKHVHWGTHNAASTSKDLGISMSNGQSLPLIGSRLPYAS